MAMSQLLHASAVAIGAHAVLLTGPSGSGKSDVALRLIDRGAKLVGDDAVILDEGQLSGPARLKGQIEVRGVGIVQVPYKPGLSLLSLHIELVPRDAVPRMPSAQKSVFGCPLMTLHAFDQSTPLKIETALRSILPQSNVVQL